MEPANHDVRVVSIIKLKLPDNVEDSPVGASGNQNSPFVLSNNQILLMGKIIRYKGFACLSVQLRVAGGNRRDFPHL